MRQGKTTARVVAEFQGMYKLKDMDGEFLGKTSGKLIFDAADSGDFPAVGDWVEVIGSGGEIATIISIAPRKTVMVKRSGERSGKRIIAANVDIAFVVEAIDRDYNLNRFERYAVLAKEGGIVPIAVLNKVDLIAPEKVEDACNQIRDRFPDLELIITSAVAATGLDALRAHTKVGVTCCFVGSSGVGKSSLINALLGRDEIRTRETSIATGRGKHATTGRDMYFLEGGGAVIDNPGMREVGLADADAGLKDAFSEIESLSRSCRFSDCRHAGEPGCAVRKAIEAGSLSEEKFQNYLRLSKEAAFFSMADREKRAKDRKFGKMIKRTLKEQKNSP